MTKLATVALVLLAMGLGDARAASLVGKPVPLFPKLTWGMSEQAALANGLESYTTKDTQLKVVGLPSVTIGGIDFSAQAEFGKTDVRAVRSGLNTIRLQHEGYVPTQQYNTFLHFATGGFLYSGRGSTLDASAVFYDAIDGSNNIVVTSSENAKISLSVAVAPGRSK